MLVFIGPLPPAPIALVLLETPAVLLVELLALPKSAALPKVSS